MNCFLTTYYPHRSNYKWRLIECIWDYKEWNNVVLRKKNWLFWVWKNNYTWWNVVQQQWLDLSQLASVQGFKNQKTSKALAASFSATITPPLCPCWLLLLIIFPGSSLLLPSLLLCSSSWRIPLVSYNIYFIIQIHCVSLKITWSTVHQSSIKHRTRLKYVWSNSCSFINTANQEQVCDGNSTKKSRLNYLNSQSSSQMKLNFED